MDVVASEVSMDQVAELGVKRIFGGKFDDKAWMCWLPEKPKTVLLNKILPIEKVICLSRYGNRSVTIWQWRDGKRQHFLNLWGDSVYKNGLFLKNSLLVNQRNYRENGELYNLYSSFRDSLQTVDKIQFSRLDNEFGYQLYSKRFKFSTALNRGYWRFFTLGSQTRTEWDVRSNVVAQLTNAFEISLKLNVNLIGADFQRNLELNLVKKGTDFSHFLNGGWSELLPNPDQRTYFSNTLDFQIDQPELQKNLFLSYRLSSNKKDFTLSIGFKSMKDYYFFDGLTWSNDLFSSVSLFYTNMVKTFKWNSFHVQPNLTLTSLSGIDQVIPKFDFRGRFFWKKRVFYESPFHRLFFWLS